MTSERITVVIADDHPLYLTALSQVIREDPALQLLAESSNGREALEKVIELKPDVAVLDMTMPGLGGIQVLNAIERESLGTKTVLVSGDVDPAMVYEAMSLGASAYLSKLAGQDAIRGAIKTAARGEVVLHPETHLGLAREIRTRSSENRPVLSDREREILRLTADGNSAPAIAEQLHLSTATVKTHLQNVYGKLEVSDRAAAVAEAMRRGLIE